MSYQKLPFHPRNPETLELLVTLIIGRKIEELPRDLQPRIIERCVEIFNNYAIEYLRIYYGEEAVKHYNHFLVDDKEGVGDLQVLLEQIRQVYKSFTDLVSTQSIKS